MNLITQTIHLPDRYTVPDTTEEARNDLALRATSITAVASADDNEAAGEIVRDIRKYIKDAEFVRTTISRPLLDAQKQLKALVDDHVAPLVLEQQRIERLAVQFAQAESRRVAREQEEQQAAYRKAEAERMAAEAKALAAMEKASTEKQQVNAIKLAQAAEAKAAEVATVLAAPAPVVQKSKGQQTKKVLCYEVTDLKALYAARPELCTIEAKASAIKAVCVPELPVPGLKLWYEDRVVFSSAGNGGNRF